MTHQSEGMNRAKVKEMMALASNIAVGCEGCIADHVHDATKAGAAHPEVLETIGGQQLGVRRV